MPENQAGAGGFLNTEKIEFGPQAAVIPALGFLDFVQIFVELGLREKARTVNALHLRIIFRALPVSAGDVGELERLDPPGGGYMGSTAEIDELSGGVKGNHGLGGFFLDELAFESLALLTVQLERFRLGKHLAFVGNVARGNFVHAFFDGGRDLRG